MNFLLAAPFLLTTIAHAPPPHPHGRQPVCFEVCDVHLANCEELRAVAVDGQVEGLTVPEGKFVTREVRCSLIIGR